MRSANVGFGSQPTFEDENRLTAPSLKRSLTIGATAPQRLLFLMATGSTAALRHTAVIQAPTDPCGENLLSGVLPTFRARGAGRSCERQLSKDANWRSRPGAELHRDLLTSRKRTIDPR